MIREKVIKIIKAILWLIFLPFNIIKKTVVYMVRSIKFSIRKKISFNYLFLYSVIYLMTIVIVISMYIPYEFRKDNNEITNNIKMILVNNDVKEDKLIIDHALKHIGNSYACEIKIVLNQIEVSKEPIIFKTSENVGISENKTIEKLKNTITKRIYSLTVREENLDSRLEDKGIKSMVIYSDFYTHTIYDTVGYILLILTICFFSGFFLLGIIGSAKSRKVLEPIYKMTKTAEKISINDISARLDVSNTKYELKDLANTLNDMLDRLNEDYEKQKRFVSDVSHELRTPISIINGYANMLERWGKEDEAVLDESIGAILEEVKNMQSLVENLLTLVRSDNQTLQYNFEEFFIDKLIFDTIKEISMIDQLNHRIIYDLEDNIKVKLDISKTKQMLRIFLDNAIKYTPKDGSIEILAYKDKDTCSIHIKDSGIGISKEDLPYLFDRFYRSDESRTRQTGGHGLGLAIAKVIVFGQKGKIKIRSKLGEGSEFIIYLPLENS